MKHINIDFQILPTFDPKVILVVDSSEWLHIEDKPSIIEVILPGETKSIIHYFDKRKVNIFNSFNLGLSCPTCPSESELVELPDGIYHFTVKGSPDTFLKERQYLKTDKTRLELDEFILSLSSNDPSNELIEKVNKINFILEAAESSTRVGDFCSAQELLFKAQKMIKKLKNCKSCV